MEQKGSGEVARWLCRCEGLSSDAQFPYQKPGTVMCVYNPCVRV